MSQRVSIDFTGLCVFATKNVPERLSVLLGADPSGMMRHKPILSFNVRNLATYSGGTVDQVIQLPDGTQVASWHLDNCLVRVDAGKQAYPGKVVLCGGGAPRSRCPADPVSEMDLCWVPSLKRVSGHGDVDPAFLGDHPVAHPGKSPLAGRIDFDCGYLFANAQVNRRSPSAFWTFDGGSGETVKQYLADTVRLEMQIPPDQALAFQVTPFAGGKPQTLELRPWNGAIEMSITNLPDMLPSPADPMTTMPHFALYYNLLKPVPKNKPVPSTSPASTCEPAPPSPAGAKGAKALGIVTVGAQGVQPVKCTPGITP